MNTQLTTQEIEKIKDIIMEQLTVERDQIISEARIMEDLGADSLDVASISMAVEDHFGVVLADENVDRMQTFGEICEELAMVLGRGTDK
jgi:acyl carrier protein